MSFLKDVYGYNPREEFNVYAGVSMGVLTPIVITRYTTVEGMIKPKGLTGEIAAWGTSVFLNLTSGLPSLVFSIISGLSIGITGANQLRGERIEEENPYADLRDGYNPFANIQNESFPI